MISNASRAQRVEVLRRSAEGDARLAAAWWLVLIVLRSVAAAFAVAMGAGRRVERGVALAAPLAFFGAVFLLLQVLTPILILSAPTRATARPRGSTTG